jgi:hypothetical protein
MPTNPFSILLVIQESNSEEFPLPQENKLARQYLKVWEKFLFSSESNYKSLTRKPSPDFQKQVRDSGKYLLDYILNTGTAKEFVYELDTQIKSELSALCDVSEFADGNFYERTANVLTFVIARTLFVLRDTRDEENFFAVISPSLFAMSRFGAWLRESQ